MNNQMNKIKRKRVEDKYGYIISLIIGIIILTLPAYTSYTNQSIQDICAMWGIVILFSLPFMVYGICEFTNEQNIETISYDILSFQVWDESTNSYQTKYRHSTNILVAYFIGPYHVKDYIYTNASIEWVRKHYSDYNGYIDLYDSKETVMKNILNFIKGAKAQKLKNQNILIKDGKIEETYTIEELEHLLENINTTKP